MTTAVAANAEISRVFTTSTRPSSIKPRAIPPTIGGCSFNRLSWRFPLLSAPTTSKSRVFSMSKENDGRSADEPGGLTYKDAGVDIDAGSELVRRIARMAPGIGGFGGLFPLGNDFSSYFLLSSFMVFNYLFQLLMNCDYG